MNNIDIRMTKAMVQLLIKHKFYGVLVQHLQIIEDETVGTMATDGVHLYYSKQWLDTLTPDEIKGVIVHELHHIVYFHHTRRKNRNEVKWNVACDYAINLDILNAGFKLPAGGLMSYAFANMSAEEIYTKIQTLQVDVCPWGMVKDVGRGEEQKTKSDIEWRVRIKQAAAVAGKGAGQLPAGVQRIIGNSEKAIIDWRVALRQFFDNQVVTDCVWSNPNKRYLDYGFVLPGPLREGVQKVGVVLDTSGSINPETLAQFYAEIQEMLDMGIIKEVILICCDAAVCGPPTVYQAHELIDKKPFGGGGTRFSPAFNWFNKNEPEIATLVYFTDLECNDYGHVPDYPVIWCAWGSESTLNRHTVPFGEIIKMLEVS